MKKNTEKKEVELTEATQFDILSKKIISKFYRNSLFTRLSNIDYEGQIRGQGDAVRMADHTMLLIEHAIAIDEKRDPAIFKDVIMIDLVTTRIAKALQEVVEKHIVKADNDGMAERNYQGNRNCLYFVAQVVPMGGYNPTGYNMKFVYGFKIG